VPFFTKSNKPRLETAVLCQASCIKMTHPTKPQDSPAAGDPGGWGLGDSRVLRGLSSGCLRHGHDLLLCDALIHLTHLKANDGLWQQHAVRAT
jgi:hypothetical protein